nr:hypothetical protein Itr_chr13CG06940 [Ipomoea trifida]
MEASAVSIISQVISPASPSDSHMQILGKFLSVVEVIVNRPPSIEVLFFPKFSAAINGAASLGPNPSSLKLIMSRLSLAPNVAAPVRPSESAVAFGDPTFPIPVVTVSCFCPNPCFRSADQAPLYMSPSEPMKVPDPSIRPDLNSPWKVAPDGHENFPFPEAFPRFHSPSYMHPSVHKYFPDPCGALPEKSPIYRSPLGRCFSTTASPATVGPVMALVVGVTLREAA